MRDPDHHDAELALRLYDLRREPEMRKARDMIGTLVMGHSTAEVERLFDYAHPENAHLRQATSYWEIAASFVNRGILHPGVFVDTCGESIFTYACFEPHLGAIRQARPNFLAQVERVIKTHAEAAARLEVVRGRVSKPPA